MNKQELFARIDQMKDELFSMACDIFDHPESDGKEYYAADLLINYLTDCGFSVEKGVGALETAFRAVWKNGEGGPNIGFLGEYDAMREVGHVCGHHLQTPAAIGA